MSRRITRQSTLVASVRDHDDGVMLRPRHRNDETFQSSKKTRKSSRKTKASPVADDAAITDEWDLTSFKKAELVALCTVRGVVARGTKAQLVARLAEWADAEAGADDDDDDDDDATAEAEADVSSHAAAGEGGAAEVSSLRPLIGSVFWGGFVAKVVSGLEWDFEAQLAFYGAYHQHPVNQAIHFVFIPLIWWTFVILAAYCPLFPLSPSLSTIGGHRMTWGTVIVATYASYYSLIDPTGGGALYSVLLVAAYAGACKLVAARRADAWKLALALNAVGWYMQIHPGHAVFEKVKPALVDSFSQALGLANLFAFYEGLFWCGWAGDLKARLAVNVAARREMMCVEQPALSFC